MQDGSNKARYDACDVVFALGAAMISILCTMSRAYIIDASLILDSGAFFYKCILPAALIFGAVSEALYCLPLASRSYRGKQLPFANSILKSIIYGGMFMPFLFGADELLRAFFRLFVGEIVWYNLDTLVYWWVYVVVYTLAITPIVLYGYTKALLCFSGQIKTNGHPVV